MYNREKQIKKSDFGNKSKMNTLLLTLKRGEPFKKKKLSINGKHSRNVKLFKDHTHTTFSLSLSLWDCQSS